jgi:hypothetical protein
MTGRLESRVALLERRSAPSWRAFIGRPFPEWPDEVLDALIADADGLDPTSLTAAELRLLEAYEDAPE